MACRPAGLRCPDYLNDESKWRKQETPYPRAARTCVNEIDQAQSTKVTKWLHCPHRHGPFTKSHLTTQSSFTAISIMRVLTHLLIVALASLVAARSAQHVGKVLPEPASKVMRFAAAPEAYRVVEKRASPYLNASTTSLSVRSISETTQRLIYSQNLPSMAARFRTYLSISVNPMQGSFPFLRAPTRPGNFTFGSFQARTLQQQTRLLSGKHIPSLVYCSCVC